MALRVKAVERLLKFDKKSAGEPAQRREPGCDEGLLGRCRRGDQGLGYGRPLGGAARTGYDALRTAQQGCGEGGGREERADQRTTHHLHSLGGPEGRADQHRHPDYLHRPLRQGGEACDVG